MSVLLVDADPIAYSSCFVAEKEIIWDKDTFSLSSDMSDIKHIVDSQIDKLVKSFEYDRVVLFLTGSTNFRAELNENYKSGRTARKPMGLEWVRTSLMPDKYEVITAPRIEADDLLGIYATDPSMYPDEDRVVIYSIDKDLKQIPGLHWAEDGEVTVTKEEGELFFFKQVLTGDVVDGYAGCPGIGPVRARRLLDDKAIYDDYWSIIVRTYEKAGLTEEEALYQARMAYILQHGDYVFCTEKVRLWTPHRGVKLG